jgi:hypothetical protein
LLFFSLPLNSVQAFLLPAEFDVGAEGQDDDEDIATQQR